MTWCFAATWSVLDVGEFAHFRIALVNHDGGVGAVGAVNEFPVGVDFDLRGGALFNYCVPVRYLFLFALGVLVIFIGGQ